MPKVSDKANRAGALTKLGDAIRAQRQRVNLTQEALADAASINRTHMGEVERGKRNVSLLHLVRIAEAMQTRASEILAAADL